MGEPVNHLGIFLANRQILLEYAAGKVGRDAAEDLVQEAFIRMSRMDESTATGVTHIEIENVTSYMFAIVRNLALDLHRRNVREARIPYELRLTDSMCNAEPSAEDKMVSDERMCCLDAVIETLNPRWQQAFHMYYDGHPLKEIATALGVTIARAQQLVKQATRECGKRLVDH